MSEWLIAGLWLLGLAALVLAARPLGYWIADREHEGSEAVPPAPEGEVPWGETSTTSNFLRSLIDLRERAEEGSRERVAKEAREQARVTAVLASALSGSKVPDLETQRQLFDPTDLTVPRFTIRERAVIRAAVSEADKGNTALASSLDMTSKELSESMASILTKLDIAHEAPVVEEEQRPTAFGG